MNSKKRNRYFVVVVPLTNGGGARYGTEYHFFPFPRYRARDVRAWICSHGPGFVCHPWALPADDSDLAWAEAWERGDGRGLDIWDQRLVVVH